MYFKTYLKKSKVHRPWESLKPVYPENQILEKCFSNFIFSWFIFSFLLTGVRYEKKPKNLLKIWSVGFYYLTFLRHLSEKKSLKFRISTCLFGTQPLIFLRLLGIRDFQLFLKISSFIYFLVHFL